MRTTSCRINCARKLLWLTGLGASVSLFYRVQDYCSAPPQSSNALVIPYEFFNLEGKEERPREIYYEIKEDGIIISESEKIVTSDQAHAEMGDSLVKLLDFK